MSLLSQSDVGQLANRTQIKGVIAEVSIIDGDWTVTWKDGSGTIVGYFSFHEEDTTAVWTFYQVARSWQSAGVFANLTAIFPQWFMSKGFTRFAVAQSLSQMFEWIFRRSGYKDDPDGRHFLVADPKDVQWFNDWQAGKRKDKPPFVDAAGEAPVMIAPPDAPPPEQPIKPKRERPPVSYGVKEPTR